MNAAAKSTHPKKKQLKSTLGRLKIAIKQLVGDGSTFENKSRLAEKLGEIIDVDPSTFRKSNGEHRKMLNEYLHILVPGTKVVVEDIQMELKALRSQVVERDRKIEIYKKVISEQQSVPPPHPPDESKIHSEEFYFEYEMTCLFLKDILNANQNLKFENGRLYDHATFSGDPELVSDKKHTDAYLRWENGRNRTHKRIEQLESEE
jgi:hypothetical protein